MEIKIVGFDLDGTLYENTPEIHQRVRKKIYEKLSALCQIPEDKARELFIAHYEKLSSGTRSIKEITEDYKIQIGNRDLVQESIEEADIIELIDDNPALRQMLERLSNKVNIDLVTGSKKSLSLKKLVKLGISKHMFTYILTSEDGSKTTGEKYLKWIRMRKLEPGQLLYVGDNKKQDVDMPRSLGIQTCIVGNYEKANYQISNILELENLLKKIN
ncbi:MAG: HAD family hydrolase [archaeon]